MRGRTVIEVGIASCALVVTMACGARVDGADDATVSRYHAEFCEARESPAAWRDPGAPAVTGARGAYHVASPDGRYLALTETAGEARHHIRVRGVGASIRDVATVREADRGSGATHQYAWSSDSRLLFVFGLAWPEGSDSIEDMRYAYDVQEGRLLRLPACG